MSRSLAKAAADLAMLALQSDRYNDDYDYRVAVDAVLRDEDVRRERGFRPTNEYDALLRRARNVDIPHEERARTDALINQLGEEGTA